MVPAHRPAGYPDLPSIDINLQFTARENRAANRLRLWTNVGNEPDEEDYPRLPLPDAFRPAGLSDAMTPIGRCFCTFTSPPRGTIT